MKSLVLPFLALMSMSQAFASDKGNGGGGHVCPGDVEVYDLYEGRVRFDLNTIRNSTMDQDETIKWGVDKVGLKDPTLAALINLEVSVVKSKMRLRDIEIARTLDADNIYTDPGCKYEQIANWDLGIDKIIINNRIWKEMDAFQRGVLVFHEAAYSIYRRYGLNQKSVEKTRRFVAQVFSDSEITEELIILRGGFSAPSPWSPLYFGNDERVDAYQRTRDLSFRNITCSSKKIIFEMSLSKAFLAHNSALDSKETRKMYEYLKKGFEISLYHGSDATSRGTKGILSFAENNKITLETDQDIFKDSKVSKFTFSISQMGSVQNSWFQPYPHSLGFSLLNLKVTRPECNESYEIELGGKAFKETNGTANRFYEFIFINYP